MGLNLDKSTWKRITLGEVAATSKEKVDPTDGSVERYVAGEHMDTDDLRVQRWGDVGETDLGPAFHRRFHPGQVLYGSRRTYLRKVAVAHFEGVCANTTFVIETRDGELLSQEFLPFVMTSKPFHVFAIQESKGSVNPYVNWSDIEGYEFHLPPPNEQKRIGDLLWAIERHRPVVEAVAHSLQRALQVQMAARLRRFRTRRRLGDVTATRSGPSFAASDVHSIPVAGSVPVLGIPNTRSDGTIDLSDVSYVTGLPATTGTVDEASLILIRTNGNRQRIGNVYLPPGTAHGYAVSAFQFLMKANDPADRAYLYWVLSTDDMQGSMSEAASGTTGLGNLAVKWLNELELPWPDSKADRDNFLANVDAHVKAETATRDQLAALISLRSTLLSDVFGGG